MNNAAERKQAEINHLAEFWRRESYGVIQRLIHLGYTPDAIRGFMEYVLDMHSYDRHELNIDDFPLPPLPPFKIDE